MANYLPDTTAPERRRPAWLFSLVLHIAAMLAVIFTLHPTPRGAATVAGNSGGIEICHIDTDDASSSVRQVVAVAYELEAPALAPTEEPAPTTQVPATSGTSDQPKPTTSQQPSGRPAANTSARPTASASGKYDASVRVFGVQGVGTKFVYVFDRSTSMEGPPLAAAKKQLIDSLKSLDAIHQFQIIFFNDHISSVDLTGGGRRIAFASDRNKQLAAKFVGGITADGGTDRLAALKAAINLRPDVIFFLTDADDPMPSEELDQVGQLNRRIGATIATIEFGKGPRPAGENFLVKLAQLTGGQSVYVDTTQLPK